MIRIAPAILVILALTGMAVAQKGFLKGRVVDALTNEPLPFANVVIWNSTAGSTTDLDGQFIFAGIEPGFIKLGVSSVGYETKITPDILVKSAGTAFIEIKLDPSNIEVGEVQVKASTFDRRDDSPVSLRSIGVAEIEKNPGGNRDISKVIQSYPGVASTPAYRNDVIVRGGGSSENRFYLDDIEIPNLNHFSTQGSSGGTVGIINSDFIREVDFYSGGFPASRGNALSSVIQFKQKDGNPDGFRFIGTVGASDLALTADGPLGDRANFIFSVRRSYLQFLFSVIGLPFLPSYNDYQFKYRWRIDRKSELSIISLGALDQNRLNTSANQTEEQRYILSYLPENDQWNYTFGLVYKRFHDHGSNNWVFSRNMLNNQSFKYPGNDESQPILLDYRSTEQENRFRFENTRQIFGNFRLTTGVNYEYAVYSNKSFQKLIIGDQISDLRRDAEMDLMAYGLFAQASGRIMEGRLTVSGGLRADGADYSKRMRNPLSQLSPRLSLAYDLTERWTASVNSGLYFQRPPYTILGYRDGQGALVNQQNGLRYISASHFVGGFGYRPNAETHISVEAFLKTYQHYPFSVADSIALASKGADFGTFGDEEVTSTATGRAYGIEVWGRARNLWGFNPVFSYTYVRSEFTDVHQTYVPSAWDNRHILTFTATRTFRNHWDLGFKWRYVGGAPFTPFDETLSSRTDVWDTRGQGIPDYSRFNTLRLKSFHQLDIRVDKEYFFAGWSLNLYLDIQNFYNFKSDQPANLIREEDESGQALPAMADENGILRYPLRYLKNEGGTVLPTIGVIVEF